MRKLNPEFRRSLRVLRMVHELHKRGYQRLRIVPGMSPSGTAWRCSITHAGNVLDTNGALPRDEGRDCAHYSSAEGNEYFGWTDAREDTVQDLAARFVDRFPEIARLGLGRDWPYAGWYVEMLGVAERGALPIAYADWYREPEPGWVATLGSEDVRLPLPPGAAERATGISQSETIIRDDARDEGEALR